MNVLKKCHLRNCILIVYLAFSTINSTIGKQYKKVDYAVDLPNCKIPEVPLNNPSIVNEWNVTFNAIPCDKEPDLSQLSEQGVLSLTKFAKSHFDNCCYTEIMRPEQLVSDRYILSKCIPLNKKVNMSDTEFVYVTCTSKHHKNNEVDSIKMKFHSQLRIKSRIEPKLKYWEQFRDKEKPVSIMILILDSITRTHTRRGIPETMKYMVEEMDFIEFKGHHTMGEPTIENEVPMMLGTVTSDWEMKPLHYAGKYDNLPFIWKNFSDANYITMENEDAPLWHTFNFNGRTGFTSQPFDYYLRPYYLAQEKINKKQSKRTMHIGHTQRNTGTVSFNYAPLLCSEDKPIYDFLFDTTWNFLNLISPKVAPSFSFSFLTWPQHDYLASIRLLDNPLLKLMKNVRETPEIYDNTVIIFMGDHGFRWANYSDTEEGLLERDLPLLMIRLPERFQEKYPEFIMNMKENAQRVTAHIDLFKTMAHLHQIGLPDGDPQKNNHHYGYDRKYGISLFDKIPIDRTCDDAKIPTRFCACNYPLYSDEFDYNKQGKVPAIEGLTAIKLGKPK